MSMLAQAADSGPVLLVNPRMCSRRSIRLPLSLLSLAAVLDGRCRYSLLDGNVRDDAIEEALARLAAEPHAMVGVSVMPGPQVAPAIAISAAIRAARPEVPILWGGYFPTLYPEAAINAPYVDYVVRGQGETTLLDLLARLPDAGQSAGVSSAYGASTLPSVAGLTWKREGGIVHNPDRPFQEPADFPPLPYERAGDVAGYLRPSFMGTRT